MIRDVTEEAQAGMVEDGMMRTQTSSLFSVREDLPRGERPLNEQLPQALPLLLSALR